MINDVIMREMARKQPLLQPTLDRIEGYRWSGAARPTWACISRSAATLSGRPAHDRTGDGITLDEVERITIWWSSDRTALGAGHVLDRAVDTNLTHRCRSGIHILLGYLKNARPKVQRMVSS